MREGEGFSPEYMEDEQGGLNVEPAEAAFIDDGAQQCVVIEQGVNVDTQILVQYATEHGAVIEDDNGAGNEQYVVRFPEGEQQALTYDELRQEVETHAEEWAEAA